MNKKNTLLTAIIIFLLVIIGVLVFLYLSQDKVVIPEEPKDPIVQPGVPVRPGREITGENIGVKVEELSQEDLARQHILSRSMIFSQIVATYSNHDNYQSVFNVRKLATQEMIQKIEVWVDTLQERSNIAQDYQGVSSRVVNQEITKLSFSEGSATVLVDLQRELGDGERVEIDYSQIELSLVLLNNEWLINDLNSFDEI